MQGKDMKKNGFWKVSLALAWRAQWEDMALDGEKMEEKNLWGSKRNENNKWESCLQEEGWGKGGSCGRVYVLIPTDTRHSNVTSYTLHSCTRSLQSSHILCTQNGG